MDDKKVTVIVRADLGDGITSECSTTCTWEGNDENLVGAVGDAIFRSLGCIPGGTDRIMFLEFLNDAIQDQLHAEGLVEGVKADAWRVVSEMLMFLRNGLEENEPASEELQTILAAGNAIGELYQRTFGARVSGNGTTRTPQETDGAGEARG